MGVNVELLVVSGAWSGARAMPPDGGEAAIGLADRGRAAMAEGA